MRPRPPKLPSAGAIVVPRVKPSVVSNSLAASRQSQARMSRSVLRRASEVSRTVEAAMSKIDRNVRFGSYTPSTLPQPMNTYRIQIIFKSNWGDPKAITCSEIDFLGKDRVPIPGVVVTPDDPIILAKMKNPKLLCNQDMIKPDESAAWMCEWPIAVPLVLNFDVQASAPPESLRIWNGKYRSDANVKDISIHSNGTFLAGGEIPREFGRIISLRTNEIPQLPIFIHDQFDKEAEKLARVSDKYGRLPVPKARKITFRIIDTHESGSALTGLNCIELFGVNGKPIAFSKLKSIAVENGTNVFSPFKLLKDKRRTMDDDDMWAVEREPGKDILLTFELHKTLEIVMIRIWNYNGDNPRKNGVRKMRIDLDGMMMWKGMLSSAKGMTSKIIDGVTDVWLIDKEKWKSAPLIADVITSRKEGDADSASSSNQPTVRLTPRDCTSPVIND